MTTPDWFGDVSPYKPPVKWTPPRTKFEDFIKPKLDMIPEPYKVSARSSIPDTATIAPTGALTSANIMGAGLSQLGKTIPDLGKISLDFGPKWLAESIFANKKDFEEKQQRDVGWWQLPFDIASKRHSDARVRHWSGTLSDSTDATDLMMYYFLRRGPTPTPVGTSAGGMATAFNINPILPTSLLKQGVKTTSAGLASAPWWDYQGIKNIKDVKDVGKVVNTVVSPLSVVPKTLDVTGNVIKGVGQSVANTVTKPILPEGTILKQVGKTLGDLNELTRFKSFKNSSLDSGMGPSGFSPFSQFNKGKRNLDNWTAGNMAKGSVNILQPIIPKNPGYSAASEAAFELNIESANRIMDKQKDPTFMTYASVYGPAVVGGVLTAGGLTLDSRRLDDVAAGTASGLGALGLRSYHMTNIAKNLNKTVGKYWRSSVVGKEEAAVMEAIADLDNIHIPNKIAKDTSDFKDTDLILVSHPKFLGENLVSQDIKDLASGAGFNKGGKFRAIRPRFNSTGDAQVGFKAFDMIVRTENGTQNVLINVDDIDKFKKYFYSMNKGVDQEFQSKSSPSEKTINDLFNQLYFDEIVETVQKYEIGGKEYFNLVDTIPAMDHTARNIRIKILENQGTFGLGVTSSDANVVSLQARELKAFFLGTENQKQNVMEDVTDTEVAPQ